MKASDRIRHAEEKAEVNPKITPLRRKVCEEILGVPADTPGEEVRRLLAELLVKGAAEHARRFPINRYSPDIQARLKNLGLGPSDIPDDPDPTDPLYRQYLRWCEDIKSEQTARQRAVEFPRPESQKRRGDPRQGAETVPPDDMGQSRIVGRTIPEKRSIIEQYFPLDTGGRKRDLCSVCNEPVGFPRVRKGERLFHQSCQING